MRTMIAISNHAIIHMIPVNVALVLKARWDLPVQGAVQDQKDQRETGVVQDRKAQKETEVA